MSELRVTESRIPGLLQLFPAVRADDRGVFVKTFQRSVLEDLGVSSPWLEQFFSCSSRGVIRGLHFQTPPADHDKLVYCVRGAAFDVVVDLRIGSPTYGETETFSLDGASWGGVFVPKGLAHGFAALEDVTIMAYATSTEYDASSDAGIRWDSLDIDWPFAKPVVSPRDEAFPALEDFASPFSFGQ